MRLGGITIIIAMKRLILIFAEKSSDRSTLDELYQMIEDKSRWSGAHKLFQRIRQKNLDVESRGDIRLTSQYCFEEACAKTIYNLTKESAPFDPDSPYWIVPNALVTARHFGINENQIISAIISN